MIFLCVMVIPLLPAHLRMLGARLRGRTTTHASDKGSEKVLVRVLGRVLRSVLGRGLAMGFAVKRRSKKGFSEGVLRRRFREVPRTPHRRVRPLRRAHLRMLLHATHCCFRVLH